MLPFILALLLICAVAVAVLAAFAVPHLRAGARVLTPRGEVVYGRLEGRMRPVRRAVGPLVDRVLAPLGRLIARWTGPLLTSARRRMDPVLEPVLRAVEEGSDSRPRPRTPQDLSEAPSAGGAVHAGAAWSSEGRDATALSFLIPAHRNAPSRDRAGFARR